MPAQDYEIPMFDGINSNPVAPTATQGGNITYFYQEFNKLLYFIDLYIEQTNNRLGALEQKVNSLEGGTQSDPYLFENLYLTPQSPTEVLTFFEQGKVDTVYFENVTLSNQINFFINGIELFKANVEASGNGYLATIAINEGYFSPNDVFSASHTEEYTNVTMKLNVTLGEPPGNTYDGNYQVIENVTLSDSFKTEIFTYTQEGRTDHVFIEGIDDPNTVAFFIEDTGLLIEGITDEGQSYRYDFGQFQGNYTANQKFYIDSTVSWENITVAMRNIQ